MIGDLEWRILKNHGCFVCHRKQPQVTLEVAHLKAKERSAKGDKAVVAMCLEHHARYDKSDPVVLKQLGISVEEHKRYLAPRGKSGDGGRGALIHRVRPLID